MGIGYFKDYQIGIPGEKSMEKEWKNVWIHSPKSVSVLKVNMAIQALKKQDIINSQRSRKSV